MSGMMRLLWLSIFLVASVRILAILHCSGGRGWPLAGFLPLGMIVSLDGGCETMWSCTARIVGM